MFEEPAEEDWIFAWCDPEPRVSKDWMWQNDDFHPYNSSVMRLMYESRQAERDFFRRHSSGG